MTGFTGLHWGWYLLSHVLSELQWCMIRSRITLKCCWWSWLPDRFQRHVACIEFLAGGPRAGLEIFPRSGPHSMCYMDICSPCCELATYCMACLCSKSTDILLYCCLSANLSHIVMMIFGYSSADLTMTRKFDRKLISELEVSVAAYIEA